MIAILDPRAYGQAFMEGGSLLGRHLRLILGMARRELSQQYAGQAMGVVWVILHPLALTLVYVFIFGVVFRQRMGGTYELPLDYTTFILSGLIPWFSFYASMNTSCNSIVGNANLVKQFVFHLELLPAKDVVMALVVWGVGMSAIIVYTIFAQGTALFTWLLLPFVMFMQVLAMVGLAFLLSALTVFARDIRDVVQVFGTINIFLMPVVYQPGWVPTIFKPIIYINPFSYLIWVYRDVLYYGRIEHPLAWVVLAVGSVVVFGMGYRVFRRLKPYFGNVL